jgi:hypothetical protein
MLKRLLSWRKTNPAGNSVEADELPPWLDGYGGQTTDELIGLAGTHRIDSVVLAFEEAIRAKGEREGPTALSAPERVVLVVEAVEREVNNGGFDQLFRNSSKEYGADIVPALHAIGRPEVAELAQKAIEALGLEHVPTVEAIDLALEEDDEGRDEKLEELDSRYYAIAGDLAADVLSFIKVKKDEIVLPSPLR